MKRFRSSLVASFFLLLAQSAYSQCCCSGSEVAITNGAFPLARADVKVETFGKSANRGRINFLKEREEAAVFRFHVGCGNGTEAVTVEHLGVEMRIRFKVYGDFGSPKGEVPFQAGDYVAELVKDEDDGIGRKLVFREATPEEMKEIEPVAAEPDAADDQTADTL